MDRQGRLTTRELASYPAGTDVERARMAHEEAHAGAPTSARRTTRHALVAPHWSVPDTLDVRRFTGRDRKDRVMSWLLAHVPDAESWSLEALAGVAERLLTAATIVE